MTLYYYQILLAILNSIGVKYSCSLKQIPPGAVPLLLGHCHLFEEYVHSQPSLNCIIDYLLLPPLTFV